MLQYPNNNLRKAGKPLTRRFLFGATAFFCLAGCMVGPDYRSPNMKMPVDFITSSQGGQKPIENSINKPVIDAVKWWQSCNDQELNSLIEQAIRSNPNIEIALYRIQEARTKEALIIGTALPEIGVGGGGGGGTGSDISRGRAAAPLVAADNTKGLTKITHVFGFDAEWELDLFGKYRREMEASAYDTEAAIAARNTVLISIVADVARAYIDMRALQMQFMVLQRNTVVAQKYLHVTQARFNAGITNELDLILAQRQLAALQAEKMPLAAQVHAAQYVIAVLLGKFPEDLANELENPGMVPSLPEKIDAGLPLDLLRRRPDIREAERELAADTARVGVATANLFPHVSLTGGVGYQGQGLGVTPDETSFIWSVGPSVSWSLLDFGTLDALVTIADLRTREKLVNYKQTVLDAVREVDTSIGSYAGQQDRLRNLGNAMIASQRAVSIATQRYDWGLTDALNVIDAERQEYDLEKQYVSSLQTATEQFIVLYKALGGGWEQYQSFPAISQPQPAVLAIFTQLLNSYDLPKDSPPVKEIPESTSTGFLPAK